MKLLPTRRVSEVSLRLASLTRRVRIFASGLNSFREHSFFDLRGGGGEPNANAWRLMFVTTAYHRPVVAGLPSKLAGRRKSGQLRWV